MDGIVSPKIHMLRPHNPVPRKVAAFEDRAFKETIKLNRAVRVGLDSIWLVSL